MLGGHAVAQCVRNEGVRHLFCVPGESYIAVIDGLVNIPEIKLITNRQEGCAAFMAEGYAKSTRKVGRLHGHPRPRRDQRQHRHPFGANTIQRRWCFLVGQVGRNARGREAGQEIDYGQFFGSIAKWVDRDQRSDTRSPDDDPSFSHRAHRPSRPGRGSSAARYVRRKRRNHDGGSLSAIQPSPDPRAIEELVARINAARKPVLLVGSGTQYAGAWQELIDFSEKFQLPVLTSYKRQDAFPNSHPNYAGNLSSVE